MLQIIDEYDKPIIDYLEEPEQAIAHRQILKTFYSVIKDADPQIEFLLITGVSKFSKVSIFSDLNNLDDITLDRAFAALTGYTQAELEHGYHSTKWWRIKDEFSGVCQGVLGVQKAAVGSERITIREQTSNDRSARWPWPAFVVANGGDGVGQSWVGAGNDGKYRSYKWSPRETWLYAKSPDVWPHGDCAESGSPGVRERLR